MSFDQISITARLIAYMRQFSDIPFAKDVAAELHARETFEELLHENNMRLEDFSWYAPIFELRYKSVSNALRRVGATQILELASGVSLRGLALTSNPAITYVETDLGELTNEKRNLIETLRRKYSLPNHGNLELRVANALDFDDLAEAARRFKADQTTAVIHEGLFQYLSRDEIQTVANNIRKLLNRYPGVWITPDFSFRQAEQDVSPQQQRFRSLITGKTGREMYEGAFDDEEDLNTFLKEAGFDSQVISAVEEMPELTSIAALGLSTNVLDRAKSRLKLWTMTPKF